MRLEFSVQGLERLLGGDSALEVHLRQQVVAEFTKKHLKRLAGDPAIAQLAQKVTEEIKAHVGEEVWDPKTGRFTAEIRDTVQELIRLATQDAVARVAAASFDDLVKKYEEVAEARVSRYEVKLMAAANERIQKALDAIDKGLDARLDAAFERRVRAEIDRRLEAAKNCSA